jgi:hypothetical protein
VLKNRIPIRRISRHDEAMKSLMICGLAALFLAGCASDKAATPAEPKQTPTDEPRLVGRIATIPPDKRFVLIQSYGKWDVATGTILITRGPEERTANLLVTGEVLGEFAAADLQSGLLDVGDAVYLRPAPKPPSAPKEEEPAKPLETKDPEAVSKNI